MKKLILFLLLPLWAIAQTTTGQEQEFDYGIKNNSTQTITTPPYLTTTGMDGTQGKIPSALIAKTSDVADSLATKENVSNKSDSYTASSSTTYASTKALVGGLATKENAFTKNTAFNKNFGTTAGTVAEGNDSRILNGQTSFGWGNHASAGYALTTGSNINQSSFRTALGLGSNAYTSTAYLPLSGGDVSGIIKTGGFRVSGDVAVITGVGLEAYYNPSNKTVYLQNYHRGAGGDAFYPMSLGASSFSFNAPITIEGSISATSYTGGATLTDTPTAPTAAPGTTGNQIATLDYVLANSGANSGASTSGTYTPTLTNGLNVTSSTLATSVYTKIGNIVTVTVTLYISVEAAVSPSMVTISLPFNRSTSGNDFVCGSGTAIPNSSNTCISAFFKLKNNTTEVALFFYPVASGGNTLTGTFSYSI